MNQEIIARTAAIINAKTDFVGDGMEGHCVLALMDENGYPTASTITISKADGIQWLTFLSGLGDNKATRITKYNRGCVCLSTSEYNITLVGTLEILTDLETKKAMWQEPIKEYFSGPEDPEFCVLRFHTESYNLFFSDDGAEAKGTLKNVEKKPRLTLTPGLGFRGQCKEAIALYEKAFGAELLTKLLYSDANPKDLQYKEEEKDFIFYSEMVIGNQLISLGDDSGGILDESTKGKASAISLLVEFESVEALEAAYQVLAEGATIVTPLNNTGTTYCSGYVSLVDQFGIHWDLMSGYTG